ncbi:hypothetical protein J8273_5013 [Carpediemonas membranifera]|uniref:Uncharacterized protein n=1 Tax=Carpediemonas membranifera TaxID=201153 RepID=A0A8J6ASP7_9EUKA|nr:hypothetical protein J8273_5013 [Carpediemonas membranifera]|eukprot:KAG9393526.1 hypothetical protein J8273_5013 [Carpediemonas membranifera]
MNRKLFALAHIDSMYIPSKQPSPRNAQLEKNEGTTAHDPSSRTAAVRESAARLQRLISVRDPAITSRFPRSLQERLQSSERRKRRVSLGIHLLDTLPRPETAEDPSEFFPVVKSVTDLTAVYSHLHRVMLDAGLASPFTADGRQFCCKRCGSVQLKLDSPVGVDAFTPRRPRLHGASLFIQCPRCKGKRQPIDREDMGQAGSAKAVTPQDKLAERLAAFSQQRLRAMKGRPPLPTLVDSIGKDRPTKGGPWGGQAVVERATELFSRRLTYGILWTFILIDNDGHPPPAVRTLANVARERSQALSPGPDLLLAAVRGVSDDLHEQGTGFGAVALMRAIHVLRAECGVDEGDLTALLVGEGHPTPPSLSVFHK